MKKICFAFLLCFCFLIGCGNAGTMEDSAAISGGLVEYNGNVAATEQAVVAEFETDADAKTVAGNVDRMVVYEGNIAIQTTTVADVIKKVEEKIANTNGYIVESTIEHVGDSSKKNAYLFVRIPVGEFDSFLEFLDEISDKILERNISGKDVTEEFMDIESRLKAKKVYEERLFAFLEEATKTEDLLKISKDLSEVQSEIEQMEGRKKYLQNRSEFASLHVRIIDAAIDVPEIGNQRDINIMEKTKKVFNSSVNAILYFFANVIVFVVGLLPIWLFIAIIAAGIYIGVKLKKAKRDDL